LNQLIVKKYGIYIWMENPGGGTSKNFNDRKATVEGSAKET
jgi:hypothetical protein